MAICKYYQQGNCRFGDRCKFEHPRSFNGSYDARDVINRRGGFDNYDSGRGNYGSTYYNQSNARRGGGDFHTNNRFAAFSDNKGADRQRPSTQAQTFKEMSTTQIIEALSEGADIWEKGNMWLFSCVSLGTDCDCLPGFEDYSPEEIRLKAYEAQKTGNTQSYTQWISQLTSEVKNKRARLQKPDPITKRELAEAIETLKKGGSSQIQSSNLFGGGASSSSIQSSGLFGKPAAQSTGLFGKPADQSTGLFGKPADQSTGLFGKPADQSTGLFGKPANSATSVFGKPSVGNSVFGGSSNSSVFGSSASGSVFGGNSQAPSAGLFSTQTTNNQMATGGSGGAGLFGKPATFNSPFGQTKTSTPFVSTTQGNAQSAFGQSASNSPFTQSSGSLFAQDTSSKNSAFGQPATFPSPGFGSSPITPQSPTFGASPIAPQTSTFGSPVVPQVSTPIVTQKSTVSAPVSTAQTSDNASTGATSVQTTRDDKFTSLYTPLDKLTAQERAQFEAPRFVLGKIPLCPPPRELI